MFDLNSVQMIYPYGKVELANKLNKLRINSLMFAFEKNNIDILE